MAIPTTAGTGSEVTPFATVWDSVQQKKFSLAGDMVFPSIALLDPVLTAGVPPNVTLYTGLDVISHSLESIWNRASTVSEAYAIQAKSFTKSFTPGP
jgi:alcohol dehydrogenase